MLKDTLSRAAPFATKLVPPVSGIVRVFEGKGGQKVAKIAGIAEDDDYLLLRCWSDGTKEKEANPLHPILSDDYSIASDHDEGSKRSYEADEKVQIAEDDTNDDDGSFAPPFSWKKESGRGFAGWSYCGLFFAMDVAVGGGYGAADQMLSVMLNMATGWHLAELSIAKDMIRDGKRLANKSRCPLMYEWNSERYWGAAHGLAGIVHALMGVNLNEDDLKYVKGTLNYMINNRFISGNYPSIEGFNADWLVHWCHGAPGVALTLTKAARIRE
ncbi:hypothetical protein ZIOFF_060308 [Zingiber officinale]|uniref:Uncharacterized protein n=1 Tax=Zingiber officinale TaxID=94328 RepID=A0A8J5F8E5_ZINOF|nr:hypothetical protein ZIOFF_060308 [Zingiber officinale]